MNQTSPMPGSQAASPFLELDVSDPPIVLQLGHVRVHVPFWKLFYDLVAIDGAHKGKNDDGSSHVEAYRKYLVGLIARAQGVHPETVDGQVGVGDATAFQRKYWLAFDEKKSLADGLGRQSIASMPSYPQSMDSASPHFQPQ